MMRSGQLKSSIAQPEVKNIGWETIVARKPAALMLFSIADAVPTATGVTIERIGGLGAARVMRIARSERCCGLSSARKMTCALRAKDSMSVEYASRPERTFRLMT